MTKPITADDFRVLISEGVDDAFEKLLVRYDSFIRSQSQKRQGTAVDAEPLINAGRMGLYQSVIRYRPAKGVTFHSFAIQRIRGAIIDEARQMSPKSRHYNDLEKRIDAFCESYRGEHGHTPCVAEIAVGIGQTESVVHSAMVRLWREVDGGIDEYFRPWANARPTASVIEAAPDTHQYHDADFSELRELARPLDLRSQVLVYLHYGLGVPQIRIAKVLGLSQSAISDLHSRAMSVLRKHLENE